MKTRAARDDNFTRAMAKPLHLIQSQPDNTRDFGSWSPKRYQERRDGDSGSRERSKTLYHKREQRPSIIDNQKCKRKSTAIFSNYGPFSADDRSKSKNQNDNSVITELSENGNSPRPSIKNEMADPKRLMNSQKKDNKYVSIYPKSRSKETREKQQHIVQKNITPGSRLIGKEPNYELFQTVKPVLGSS